MLVVGPSRAAEVKDGDTIILDDKSFKLDGIDAPERDQVCLDENCAVWACGIVARDRLTALIGKRDVRCDDKGPDRAYRNSKRRVGVCWVEGESLSLNQLLVREGWALNFEPYAKGRFKADQADAENNRRGLWKGCFSNPDDHRRGKKSTAPLLGAACSCSAAKSARDSLFPDDAAMPPGCPIKGKFALRAKITGHLGIYHLPGCRSYQRTKSPDRWFCSEEDAQADEFRKAYTCPK